MFFDIVNVNKYALSQFFIFPNAYFYFFLNDLEISNLNGNFCLKSDIQKICKMESYCSKFYFVFTQAVLYLDLWWFLRIRVWQNWWRRVKGGGVRRNNCEWAWASSSFWESVEVSFYNVGSISLNISTYFFFLFKYRHTTFYQFLLQKLVESGIPVFSGGTKICIYI